MNSIERRLLSSQENESTKKDMSDNSRFCVQSVVVRGAVRSVPCLDSF